MARRILLALFILLFAGAAWCLRALQLSCAFAPETGLPLPLDQWGRALWGILGAAALLTALMTIPEKGGKSLSLYRPVALGAVLQGGGALLLAAGGAWQLYQLFPALRSLEAVSAVLLLLSALGLFGGMKACFGGTSKAGILLLLPMCASGAYLVLTYLQVSSDPVLRHYEMQMLTIAAAALALTLLCSLAFGAGGRRRFLILSALTVPLSAAALYASGSYAQALAFTGCGMAAFGFFLSVLFGTSAKQQTKYEVVEDPFRTGSVHHSEIREAEAQQAADPSGPAATPSPVNEDPPADNAAAFSAGPAAPAPAPADKLPAVDDAFDLSLVDHLLQVLEEEKKQK